MKIGTMSAFLLVCSFATIQVKCGPLALGERDKAVVSSLRESNPHAAVVPASSYQDKLLELEDAADPTSESVDGTTNDRQKRQFFGGYGGYGGYGGGFRRGYGGYGGYGGGFRRYGGYGGYGRGFGGGYGGYGFYG